MHGKQHNPITAGYVGCFPLVLDLGKYMMEGQHFGLVRNNTVLPGKRVWYKIHAGDKTVSNDVDAAKRLFESQRR